MKYTWLVEQYLEGELSGEALRKFELEILTKSEVAEELERIRFLNRFMNEQHQRMKSSVGLIEDFDDIENIVSESVISRELEDLKIRKISSSRDEIVDFETSLAESRIQNTLSIYRSNKVLIRRISIWMAAASLAILIAVSALLLMGNDNTDYAGLYNQYYFPRQADVLRTAPDLKQEPFHQALKAYSEGDYTSLKIVITDKHAISTITLFVPERASEKGNPPVFMPKNPTTRFRGKNIAEIIVSAKIERFILSFVWVV